MTVGELIESLQEAPDKNVTVEIQRYNELGKNEIVRVSVLGVGVHILIKPKEGTNE